MTLRFLTGSIQRKPTASVVVWGYILADPAVVVRNFQLPTDIFVMNFSFPVRRDADYPAIYGDQFYQYWS